MNEFDAHQLALLVGPCPACGSGQLRAVQPAGESLYNFLCLDCRHCWHAELDWVARVDRTKCTGCPSQSLCAPGHRADHPPAPVAVGALPAVAMR